MDSNYLIIDKAGLDGLIHKILIEAIELKPYITQNQAAKIVGRRRLEKAMKEGLISWHKLDYDNQFSRVMVKRADVEKLLNNK
jgi:hypothetical protein